MQPTPALGRSSGSPVTPTSVTTGIAMEPNANPISSACSLRSPVRLRVCRFPRSAGSITAQITTQRMGNNHIRL